MSADRLQDYRAKRDFGSTPEPDGGAPSAAEERPRFVVQKHAASTLHYDFRLEDSGVLVSWAVPKGPSMDPAQRRLAMPTEDHPMDYAGFEGVIPQGEYGGGTVIVWDRGTFQLLPPEDQPDVTFQDLYAKGRLTVSLAGEKLRGGFALIRTGKAGERARWLLIKMKDDEALPGSDITEDAPDSVLTGRSLSEVAAEEGEL